MISSYKPKGSMCFFGKIVYGMQKVAIVQLVNVVTVKSFNQVLCSFRYSSSRSTKLIRNGVEK